jgi:hypothetical protein
MLIAMVLPSGDLSLEGLLVWNSATEALARQDAEFGFGHVEPASMFGGSSDRVPVTVHSIFAALGESKRCEFV